MFRKILIGAVALTSLALPKAAHASPLCDMVSYTIMTVNGRCVDLTAFSGIDDADESLSALQVSPVTISDISVLPDDGFFTLAGTVQNNSKETVFVRSATITLRLRVTGKKRDIVVDPTINERLLPGQSHRFKEIVDGKPPEDYFFTVDRIETK
jgi:hypothetical protein